MDTVGVRELKEQASRLLRRVREEGAIIDITYHGEIIARLIPADPPQPAAFPPIALALDPTALQAGRAWR